MWYVLYTKPRNEKKVALLLASKGVEVYCPTQEIVRQWSDRKKKIQEPIFKSYVFVLLENYEDESVDVLTTPGAVRFLWWQGKPGIVRNEEIMKIKDFLSRYRNASINVDIREGQAVTINEGPLKDNSGIVIKVHGKRAILHLKSLGWHITADIPFQSLSIDNQ